MQKKLYCGWEDYIYTLMNLKSRSRTLSRCVPKSKEVQRVMDTVCTSLLFIFIFYFSKSGLKR